MTVKENDNSFVDKNISVDGDKNARIVVAAMSMVTMLMLFLVTSLFYYSYLDEKIESGVAYGFTIGDDAQDVYDKLLEMQGRNVFFGIRVGDHKDHIRIIDKLSENDFHFLKHFEEWTLAASAGHIYVDTVVLGFSKAKLTQIHRHKQMFILPAPFQRLLSDDY